MKECDNSKIYIQAATKSTIHKESNKMQQCIKFLLVHIYMKLNMFRAMFSPIIRSTWLYFLKSMYIWFYSCLIM